MAETIGTVIGTIIAWLIILAIPGVPIWLLVRRSKNRKAAVQTSVGAHRASGQSRQASEPDQTPPAVPAGWYQDPTERGVLRWWDGFQWGPQQSKPLDSPDPKLMARYGDPKQTAAARAEQDQELTDRLRMPEPVKAMNEAITIAPRFVEQKPLIDAVVPRREARPHVAPRKIGRNSKLEWVPAGQPIEVAGYVIEGGLLYVGHDRSHRNEEVEPSLIDPSLRVNSANPDYAGKSLSYWPSYAGLSAEARAAYLEWLGRGRRDADVPIGYVFLFMYGLERRVLTEIANNPKLAHEVPAIQTEMQQLLALHSDDYSFQSYGSGFMDILELITLQGEPDYQFEPPQLTEHRWSFPFGLKVELGSLAADGKPVPAKWALAWAWYHQGTRIRTPATRCFDEFSTIFTSLYSAAHGTGLVAKPTKRKMKISYNPASSAIPMADVSINGISDVSESPAATRELERLADQAQDLLDSYSRFLGKNPNASSSLKAQALLPVEVLDASNPAVTEFRAMLESAVTTARSLDAADLIKLWNGSMLERLPKQETIQLRQLAEKVGFGLEPDPRFGGPALQAGPQVTVFTLSEGAPQVASPEYTVALTLTHLGVAVSKADGHVLEVETQTLFKHVGSSLGLNAHERARLEAHAHWLVQSEVKLTGLTKRLAALTLSQRESLGHLLIDIAAVDRVVKPEEVRTISKIYKLLGLDESVVTSRLHHSMTGAGSLRDDPVTVRQATVGEPGAPIPPRPVAAPAPAGFTLDTASIDAKMRDTAAVSAMLANIFDEDTASTSLGRRVAVPTAAVKVSPSTASGASEPAEARVSGLDPSHSQLLRLVTQLSDIGRAEFDALCQPLGLLPNGALDTINDAALEACDEPLLDGDEHLTINPYALEEMLR